MLRRVILAVVLVSVVTAVAAGPAAAGDGSTIIDGGEGYTAAPGEEVEVVVSVNEHTGLENITLVADYDESVLTATDVEAEGWFEENDDGEFDVNTDSEIEDGTVTLTQVREPADDGTIGDSPFATITFEVAEDAESGSTTIGLENSAAYLAGGFPQAVFAHPQNVDEGQEVPDGPQIQIEAGSEQAPGLTVVTALIALLALAVGVRKK